MAEVIEIPVFDDRYSRALIACGQLVTDDPDVLRQLAEVRAKESVAVVGAEQSARYVTILAANSEGRTPKHLHIEVADPSYFANKPDVTNEEADRAIGNLSRFVGHEIKVHAIGRFEVPREEFDRSGLGRLSNIKVNLGDLAIEQTGAEFKLSGVGPVGTIEVAVIRRKKVVRLQIEFFATERIDRGYLVRLHSLALDVLRKLVLGDSSDAKE